VTTSTTPKADARRQRRIADAYHALERAEKRLHRAFTAWSNARATVRRYDAEAVREFGARASSTSSAKDDGFNDPLPPTGGQGE
jgi:hypothetical protein